MQATVPTPAPAAQLAASITFLLSDDGTNVNGAIVARLPASGGQRSARSSPPSGPTGTTLDVPPSSASMSSFRAPSALGDVNYIRTRGRIGLHCRHKEGGFLNGGNAASHGGSD